MSGRSTESHRHLAGLEIARVIALCLVTAQHALALLGRRDLTTCAGLTIGQVGVALFLIVSGYLSAETSRPALSWISQRLRRIFPAYWCVMIPSFVLTAYAGHKEFGAGQIAAQILGFGLFTHGDNLVNTPTWFISVLLACYAATFVLRLLKSPLLGSVIGAVGLCLVVSLVSDPWPWNHCLSYAIGSVVAWVKPQFRRRVSLICALSLLIPAVWCRAGLGYTAVGLLLVELSLFAQLVPRPMRLISRYSYEFYLLHGITLFGCIKVLKLAPLAAVISGVLLAALSSIALHHFVKKLDDWPLTRRLFYRLPIVVTSPS